jgi:hypothetical protein
MTWQTKVGRAKRHYAELEAALASFFAAAPYKVSTRKNDEGKLVYYLSDVADVPDEISLIIGDVIQNLRSALDQLAYTLWVNEAGGQGKAERVYFPIDKDQASYNKNKVGAYMTAQMKKMPGLPDGMNANMPDLSVFCKPADNLFPLKAGEELFIGSTDDEEDPNMKFRFNVLLNEPGVVDGEPVTDVLSAMIAEVERVGPLFNV